MKNFYEWAESKEPNTLNKLKAISKAMGIKIGSGLAGGTAGFLLSGGNPLGALAGGALATTIGGELSKYALNDKEKIAAMKKMRK